jgi:LysR family cys regulon transcriptional activator
VLRQQSVLRDYVLEFIHLFAPHLDRQDVVRALAADVSNIEWTAVPHWRDRQTTVLRNVA